MRPPRAAIAPRRQRSPRRRTLERQAARLRPRTAGRLAGNGGQRAEQTRRLEEARQPSCRQGIAAVIHLASETARECVPAPDRQLPGTRQPQQ